MISPIIIIGAARSGTNMLRDVLCQLPGFGTWPCDEINYIWRHGNRQELTDEFASELATEQVRSFIRRSFARIAKKQKLSYVVEKTCANSLRVSFVNRIFPEAQFIHIIRDGWDVVASALKRWTAPLDLSYIMRKARFVPLSDLPYYASHYFWNRIYRLVSGKQRLAFWGPRFKGMEKMLRSHSLPEVCAMQWGQCVEKSEYDFTQLVPDRVYTLKYEDFVANPSLELLAIAAFLNISLPEKDAQQFVQNVSSQNIGKWKKELDPSTLTLIEPLITTSMKRYAHF